MDTRLRSQHPRRLSKVAGQPTFRRQASSNTRALVPREWEPVLSPARNNDHEMSPESPLFPDDAPLQETLNPDIVNAERISREIEALAQQVDQWLELKKSLDPEDSNGPKRAAMHLIGELKEVATTKHSQLKREHEHTRRRENLSSSWQGRIQGVADRAGRSASIGSANASSVYGTSEVVDEIQHWQAEVNTWDLFRTVTDYDINKVPPEAKQTYTERNPTNQFTEGADLWTHFIFLNDLAREKKIMLEWLERCAQNGDTSLETVVQQLEQKAGASAGTWSRGWMTTREKIKGYKRLTSIAGPVPQTSSIPASDSSRLLVTQLDPDAPTRQERVLERRDDYYERALWITCYEMLRRGTSWEEISEWCEEHNESWRAASLGASQKFQRKSSRLCLSGPYSGALWRRMCLKAAHNPTADKYERAVYGLLAGDVQSVEPVCQSWEDSLYVNYNSLLLAEFEDWLQKNHPHQFPSVLSQKLPLYKSVRPQYDLEAEHHAIMDATYTQRRYEDDPDMPIKHLQASLVSHNFPAFAEELAYAIRREANPEGETPSALMSNSAKCEPRFLLIAKDWNVIRIAAHMVIVHRSLGFEFEDEGAIDDIIVSYMSLLRQIGKFEALTTYASCLNSEDTRNRVLGVMISDVTEKSEQDRLIALMDQADLDMTIILSKQWEYCLARLGIGLYPDAGNPSGPNQTISRFPLVQPAGEKWAGWRIADTGLADNSVEDKPALAMCSDDEQRLVRSLEWFFKIRAPWGPTFRGIATVMKALLRTGHFKPALAVANAVPYDEMSRHLSPIVLNGRSVNVHEDPEFIKAEHPTTLSMVRTTRSSSQPVLVSVEKEEGQEEKEWPYTIAILKEQSRQVMELQSLCHLLEALSVWRFLEDNIESDMSADQSPEDKRLLVMTTLTEDIIIRMAPLFGSFLTETADEADSEICRLIRHAYIPDIILAYNGIITYASLWGEKEVLFKSLELANAIADEKNYELANAFLLAGRMGQLVESLAKTQSMLLRLNQRELRADRKADKLEERRERIREGPDVLFGEGKGELIKLKRRGVKPRGLRNKKSKDVMSVGEWEGQSVDIWAPR